MPQPDKRPFKMPPGGVPDLGGMGQAPPAPEYPDLTGDTLAAAVIVSDIVRMSAAYISNVIEGATEPTEARVNLAMKFLDDAQMFAVISPASPIYERTQELIAQYRAEHEGETETPDSPFETVLNFVEINDKYNPPMEDDGDGN